MSHQHPPQPLQNAGGQGGAKASLANCRCKRLRGTFLLGMPETLERGKLLPPARIPLSAPTSRRTHGRRIQVNVPLALGTDIAEFSQKLSKRGINNLRQTSLTFGPMFSTL